MKDKTYFEFTPDFGRVWVRLKCYRAKSEPEKAVVPSVIFVSTNHYSFKDLRQNGFMLVVGWWDFAISFGVIVPTWIYGKCNGTPARKHIKNGNVQFAIFKEGDQKEVDGVGHLEDKWVDFDSSHWQAFEAN